MAGMFYSLAEAAEKLNKTEEEIKQIVRDGQLREFRDGPNLLFKVEEVEALMPDADIPGPSEVEAEEPTGLDLELPELQPEEISETDIILEILDIEKFFNVTLISEYKDEFYNIVVEPEIEGD